MRWGYIIVTVYKGRHCNGKNVLLISICAPPVTSLRPTSGLHLPKFFFSFDTAELSVWHAYRHIDNEIGLTPPLSRGGSICFSSPVRAPNWCCFAKKFWLVGPCIKKQSPPHFMIQFKPDSPFPFLLLRCWKICHKFITEENTHTVHGHTLWTFALQWKWLTGWNLETWNCKESWSQQTCSYMCYVPPVSPQFSPLRYFLRAPLHL